MAQFEIGVHAIVFDDMKRVLMAHRRDMDLWDLPGGGMDHGELPTDAAIRETKEETGLDVEVERLLIIATTPENILGFTFLCKIVGGEITTTDESDDVRFFGQNELPEHMSPRKRAMIEYSAQNPKEVVYRFVNLPTRRQ
jgi:8-oxo-dGTP diphosphatase